MILIPILRRTFSKFEVGERRHLGEKAKRGVVINQNNPKVVIQTTIGFIEGPITLYKGINAKVISYQTVIIQNTCVN